MDAVGTRAILGPGLDSLRGFGISGSAGALFLKCLDLQRRPVRGGVRLPGRVCYRRTVPAPSARDAVL